MNPGNNIMDLLQNHHPETVRFLLLSTHYRSPIEYSEDQLAQKAKALETFYRFFERFERITGESFYKLKGDRIAPAIVAEHANRFIDNLNDDFNTGGAVGTLFELLTELNKFADTAKLETEKPAAAIADFRVGVCVLREFSNILGLFSTHPPTADRIAALLSQR